MNDHDKKLLKQQIIDERGYWHEFHAYLLDRRPEFLSAYLDFQQWPFRSGVLDRKLCEFIYIAIDASVDHMYARGAQRHSGFALEHGATEDEILQVLLLTSVVSATQPVRRGMAIVRELESGSGEPASADMETVDGLTRTVDAYEQAMLADGPISKKDMALICVALTAAPTCLDDTRMRVHIGDAFEQGATRAEIAAALQLSAALAIHTCTIGIPGLKAALEGKPVD